MEIKQITFNEKQLEIISAMKKGTTRFFLEGGIRSGKSVLACYMIDWYCSHMAGLEAYVYRDSYESITKDTHRIMKDKPGFLNGKGVWKNGSKEFHYNNGSKIFFQYTKGGLHTLGQTAGLIYFEQIESIKEADYDIIVPRLSQWGPAAIVEYLKKFGSYVRAGKMIRPRNILMLSANPRANWLKKRYIDTDGLPDFSKEGQLIIPDNLKKEKITRFHLSTYDNIQNLGEEYQAQMETASDAFKKQYYDGSWTFNTGLIYSEFNFDDYADGGNVVNFEWEVENDFKAKNFRTIVAIDPGWVKSKFAALFCAILPDNTLYFFDEVVRNGKDEEDWDKINPYEFAALLKEQYKKRNFLPSSTIIDPASHSVNAGAGSISSQLLKAGIATTSAKKSKEYQSIMGIKSLFKTRKILVNSRCQEFIRELGLYAWDERAVISGDQKPLNEENDLCDCAKYIYNSTPHPSTVSQTYKQILDKNYSGENLYKNWVKSWFGKKDKKPNILGIDNKGKGNFGI